MKKKIILILINFFKNIFNKKYLKWKKNIKIINNYLKDKKSFFFSPSCALIPLIILSKLLLILDSTSASKEPNLTLDFWICFNLFNFLSNLLTDSSLLITLVTGVVLDLYKNNLFAWSTKFFAESI